MSTLCQFDPVIDKDSGPLLVNYTTKKNKKFLYLAVTATFQNSFVDVEPSMMTTLAAGSGYRGTDVE